MTCKNCGANDIDYDEISGASVCTNCGVVLEENNIVSSIEFQESSSGASNVVGRFVSATCTSAYSHGGLNRGFSKQPRVETLRNGKNKISALAAQLRLPVQVIESANRLYMMAITHNFSMGRKISHVIAACLYIACRNENSATLLIDFSDVLQTNVFVLGTCYLQLCRILSINLPSIDPSLYLHRFSAQLEFGDQTQVVANTATRLVASMKRDWIATGRRPAGLCGAALLIAGRTHNFHRTLKDVSLVVHVCEDTIRQRLNEFRITPAAQLTLEQFGHVVLTSECNPPAYTRNREQEAFSALRLLCAPDAEEDGNDQKPKLTSLQQIPMDCDDEEYGFNDVDAVIVEKATHEAGDEVKSYQKKRSKKAQHKYNVLHNFYDSIGNDILITNEKEKKGDNHGIKSPLTKNEDMTKKEDLKTTNLGNEELLPISVVKSEMEEKRETNNRKRPLEEESDVEQENVGDSEEEIIEEIEEDDVVDRNPPLEDEEEEDGDENEDEDEMEGDEEQSAALVVPQTLSDLDDDEIDSFILSNHESQLKESLWTRMNHEYLTEQASRPPSERKARTPSKRKEEAESAQESVMNLINSKRLSRKINYDVLEALK